MTDRFDRFYRSIVSESHGITINGEYWFDERGNAMYADGDVGDMNHEAYVIQRCLGEVANYFGIYADGEESMSNLEESILHVIIKNMDVDDPNYDSMVDDIQNDPARAIINYMVQNGVDEQKASDLVLIAYGSSRDAREYAIKNWNWIRVHGANIEVNKLNVNTLAKVANGISNALEEEGLIYDEDGEEEALNGEYRISTYSGKRYVMTLRDMESGNTSGLENDELEVKKSAATQQVRNMDVQAMPSYYQKKGIIGDSVSFNALFKSKIVKESVITTPVYHGGNWNGTSPIKMSARGSLGGGAYFTPNIQRAEQYAKEAKGSVIEAVLDVKNPLIIEQTSTKPTHPCIEALIKLGMPPDKALDLVEKVEEQKGYIGKEIATRAIKQGYDALMQYRDGNLSEIVIWNPAQVRINS